MKTDDLLRVLAADAKQSSPQFGWLASFALGAAAAGTAVIFFAFLGLRPDFGAVVSTPRFALKFAVVVLLACSAAGLLLRTGRPGASLLPWLLATAFALTMLLAGVAGELAVLPSTEWLANLRGKNWLFCLTVIPALSIVPLAVTIAVLRYGAPSQPNVAGAIAGLASGGIGAFFYALNCDNDSPLFVAAWYSLAIGFVVFAGSVAGSRLLRW